MTRDGLHRRGGPGTAFAIVGKLARGSRLRLIREDGEWRLVDLQGHGVPDGFVGPAFRAASGADRNGRRRHVRLRDGRGSPAGAEAPRPGLAAPASQPCGPARPGRVASVAERIASAGETAFHPCGHGRRRRSSSR